MSNLDLLMAIISLASFLRPKPPETGIVTIPTPGCTRDSGWFGYRFSPLKMLSTSNYRLTPIDERVRVPPFSLCVDYFRLPAAAVAGCLACDLLDVAVLCRSWCWSCILCLLVILLMKF